MNFKLQKEGNYIIHIIEYNLRQNALTEWPIKEYRATKYEFQVTPNLKHTNNLRYVQGSIRKPIGKAEGNCK